MKKSVISPINLRSHRIDWRAPDCFYFTAICLPCFEVAEEMVALRFSRQNIFDVYLR